MRHCLSSFFVTECVHLAFYIRKLCITVFITIVPSSIVINVHEIKRLSVGPRGHGATSKNNMDVMKHVSQKFDFYEKYEFYIY